MLAWLSMDYGSTIEMCRILRMIVEISYKSLIEPAEILLNFPILYLLTLKLRRKDIFFLFILLCLLHFREMKSTFNAFKIF